MRRRDLSRARRIVIKVGTSLLASPAGAIRSRRFGELAREISGLVRSGKEIVLVSSGAVGLGARRLGQGSRPSSIPQKQAAAAVGQIDLCRRYERAFARHDLAVGQILLTHAGLEDRERFLNARHTLHELLRAGAIPLINENDSVATEELRFGDNDRLSSLVVNNCAADLLVLLSDVDGLHDRDPGEPGARRIADVEEVTSGLLELADKAPSPLGTGGMRSKLEAAGMAARFGAPTVIADGHRRGVLERVLAGDDIGTLVQPAQQQLSSRKHWIAYSLKPRGRLLLDAGAVRAIRELGRSLLPIGVLGVDGSFGVGDLVSCREEKGAEVARGLISYSSSELEVIKGHRTPRIPQLLGYSNGPEVIHRDDLVLV